MSRNLVALTGRLVAGGRTAFDLLGEVSGPVEDGVIADLARSTGLPAQHVRTVAEFYDELSPTDGHASHARVRVCDGEACRVAGGDGLADSLVERLGGEAVGRVTCLGLCSRAPVLGLDTRVVAGEGEGANQVVAAIRTGRPLSLPEPENAVHAPAAGRPCLLLRRMVAAPSGRATGFPAEGYAALARARSMPPEAVIAEIVDSGLRGRGGAGFPTGAKLAAVAAAPSPDGRRFVIANLDEGDAGAFIDKELAERDPHALIEGILIAAHACGAGEGIIYVRHEYPHAFSILRHAIEEVVARGEDGCALRLVRGQGAYICGEETSLIRSIEGLPATAGLRPPYPAEAGLWGCPTAVNNVETLCTLPWILRHGGAAYARIGRPGSTGTKLVSLNNRLRRPGLYEVEMGTPLREVLFGLAGGMIEGHRFRAVQIGGPLGAILPEAALDVGLGFESLAAVGGTLGHGGMVVFSDHDDLLRLACGLMAFAARESCGRCFPCRIGTVRASELLERIAEHGLTPGREAVLRDLCETLRLGSLCGLGGMAPTPIESLLTHFPDIWRRTA
ncbi:MAG: NAD(P)H-dependent oxidoreductase subunit E [Alphaproteobacteria bacterium]